MNRIAAYLCPSCTDELEGFKHVSAQVLPSSGVYPYTTHYHGVKGSRGTNTYTGKAYLVLAETMGHYGGYAAGSVYVPEAGEVRLLHRWHVEHLCDWRDLLG